ncbi:unnamed protein product [Sphagnum jensenii]|uniref:60S ribosomal protein L6 n=1 Tax=Sphagnum jensenii TaxID=128206 RepID=A0ABP1B4U3_9BRYO
MAITYVMPVKKGYCGSSRVVCCSRDGALAICLTMLVILTWCCAVFSFILGSIRSSISAGTILILLAGHFKGKRVVFLKQLESGLLLVTGPFKVNGVPLKRVNQAYVIATSTKVDISAVDVAKYSDAYFKREVTKKKKGESQFFEAEKEEEKSLPLEKIEDQKAIDAKLVPLIEAVPELKSYLASRFGLKSGVKPHELVF